MTLLAARTILRGIPQDYNYSLLGGLGADDGTWAATNVTSTKVLGPDGHYSAIAINETVTNAAHAWTKNLAGKAASAIQYRLTGHFRHFPGLATTHNAFLGFSDGANGAALIVNLLDWSTVTFAAFGAGTSVLAGSTEIAPLRSGWFRLGFTATSSTSTVFSFILGTASGAGISFAGTVGVGLAVWGPQLTAA